MTLKVKSLLRTPISHTPFPTTAPYSRDNLVFANNFVGEILKWQELCAKEIQELEIPERYVELKGTYVFEWLLSQFLGENREKEWLPHREPIEFKKKGETKK